MGAPVTPDTVISSARATALYLAEQDPPIRRVLVLGAGGLEREARDVGLEVVTAAHAATRMQQEGIDGYAAAGEPDAVLVGLDPNLTYLRLAAAADCVRAGARFIATNRDPVYPTERGLRPGAGAIVAAVEATTGVTPISIGKPAPRLLEIAAHAVGRDPREAIMVGDGILTDLAAANALGARCVFMLTGVSTREQLRAPRAGRPACGRRRGRGTARRSARDPGRRAGHRRRAGLTQPRPRAQASREHAETRHRGLRRALCSSPHAAARSVTTAPSEPPAALDPTGAWQLTAWHASTASRSPELIDDARVTLDRRRLERQPASPHATSTSESSRLSTARSRSAASAGPRWPAPNPSWLLETSYLPAWPRSMPRDMDGEALVLTGPRHRASLRAAGTASDGGARRDPMGPRIARQGRRGLVGRRQAGHAACSTPTDRSRASTGCRRLTGNYLIRGDEVEVNEFGADGEVPRGGHVEPRTTTSSMSSSDGFRAVGRWGSARPRQGGRRRASSTARRSRAPGSPTPTHRTRRAAMPAPSSSAKATSSA